MTCSAVCCVCADDVVRYIALDLFGYDSTLPVHCMLDRPLTPRTFRSLTQHTRHARTHGARDQRPEISWLYAFEAMALVYKIESRPHNAGLLLAYEAAVAERGPQSPQQLLLLLYSRTLHRRRCSCALHLVTRTAVGEAILVRLHGHRRLRELHLPQLRLGLGLGLGPGPGLRIRVGVSRTCPGARSVPSIGGGPLGVVSGLRAQPAERPPKPWARGS